MINTKIYIENNRKSKKLLFCIVIPAVILITVLVVLVVNSIKKEETFPENTRKNYDNTIQEAIGNFTAKTATAILNEEKNTCYSPFGLIQTIAILEDAHTGSADLSKIFGYDTKITPYDMFAKAVNTVNGDWWYNYTALWKNDVTDKITHEKLEESSREWNYTYFNEEAASDKINQFISDGTDNVVTEFGTPTDREKTYLINTAYYSNSWYMSNGSISEPVKKFFQLQNGEKITAEYIEFGYSGKCIKGKDFTAISIEFTCGELNSLKTECVFILPDEGKKLCDIVTGNAVNELLCTYTSEKFKSESEIVNINAKIPIFSYNSTIDVRPALDKLKLTALYGESSSFDNSTEMKQVTMVEMNENGIYPKGKKASLWYIKSSYPVEEREQLDLTFDRPFAYIIIREDIPILVGTVYNPAE